MSFLSRLFKPKPPLPSVTHPLFGEMQAVIDYGDGMYYWETAQPIKTRLGELEPAFDSSEAGPTQEQAERWTEIVEKFERYHTAAEPLLRENLAGFQEEHDFDSLTLGSIDFHNRPHVEYEWQLTYETPNGRIYTVLFVGEEPKVVTVDG